MKSLLLIFFIGIAMPIFSQTNDSVVPYKNDPLYMFIQKWWDAPYKYGGESQRGIDCSAFTSKLIKQVYHIELPRTAREQYNATQRIKKDELKDGDLVFFRTRVKSGWHVGVYITDGYFIHSRSRKGVTINSLNESTYTRIFYGAGRLKNHIF